MWDTILATLAREFSDVTDVEAMTQLVLRLAMAALLGGLVGLERELRGKEAGVRTHMMLALAACLFVAVPAQLGMEDDAVSRVMQGILAGVGLLCAGSILKQTGEDQERGLTTAAGLWMTTAIGVAAGVGREATAVISTLLALGILELERPLRRWRVGKDG